MKPPARVAASVAALLFLAAAVLMLERRVPDPLEPLALLLWLVLGAIGVGLTVHPVQSHPLDALRRRPIVSGVLSLGVVLGMAGAILKLHHGDLHVPVRRQVECAANLKQIGLAMYGYAIAHGGAYPDTLGELVTFHGDTLPAGIFVCRDTTDTPAAGATPGERAAQFAAGGHVSYVYLGKGKDLADPASLVLVYEPLGRHRGRGMNVLLGDGRVLFLDPSAGAALLAELEAGHNPPRAAMVAFPTVGIAPTSAPAGKLKGNGRRTSE